MTETWFAVEYLWLGEIHRSLPSPDSGEVIALAQDTTERGFAGVRVVEVGVFVPTTKEVA